MSGPTASPSRTTLIPVKICHVTTVDRSLVALLLNQLLSLVEEGYEVVTISSPGEKVAIIEEAGFRHIPVTMTRRITPLRDLRALWQLYRVMRREAFTIVHTHNPKPGLLGQIAARLAHVPIIVNTVHGFYFHERMNPFSRRLYIACEKIAARCSDLILSQNRDDLESAIRERIASPDRIKHLANGIDLSRFDPNAVESCYVNEKRRELSLDQDMPVVGFVGRLTKRKGFRDFLLAGKLLARRRNTVRFLIVGGKDHGRSDALDADEALRVGLGEHCIFLGRQPNTELPSLYALMDVLVLPSPWEGIPRVLMEAAAMGLPLVVTNVKGNREVVVDGENGLLVPFGDPVALADAIERIIGDKGFASRMGRRSREIAVDRFDERQVFERVKIEYRRLLSDRDVG